MCQVENKCFNIVNLGLVWAVYLLMRQDLSMWYQQASNSWWFSWLSHRITGITSIWQYFFFRSFSSSQIELQYKCKFKNKYISPELLLYVTQECNREQLKNVSGFIKDDNFFLYKYKIVYTQNFSTYLSRRE